MGSVLWHSWTCPSLKRFARRYYRESGRGRVSEVVDGNGALVEVKIVVCELVWVYVNREQS